MKYAIIAAGEGSRLAQEGIGVPKPLVTVGGEPLIDRLLRIFLANDATEVCVICNERMKEVGRHLEAIRDAGQLPLRLVVKSTPSSMHSMWELSPWLGDEPFILTTVDTIFREAEFADYVKAFRRMVDEGTADGLMGVTDFVDDEKPLYVAVDEAMVITGFLDQCAPHSSPVTPHYVSGGIYGLTPLSLLTLQRAIERGESRMRNFQRALIADGLRLRAWTFSKVLDIDHASDIRQAEMFLAK